MIQREAHSPGVLARDFLLFYLKLLIDGLKGVLLIQVGILAFCVDMIFMLTTGTKRSFFYAVLELGERFDLWLNLYQPASRAGNDPDGLFGASLAGANSFLGEVEELVRRRRETPPEPATGTAAPGPGIDAR
jgi:hypothetical protein